MRAVAHKNASNSRAVATVTLFGCLPRVIIRRNRPHNLTWPFHDIA